MSSPRLCALGACLISVVYPLLGVLCRDAVAPIMVLGSLALGIYRYVFGQVFFLKKEMPDLLSFLFRPCRGRMGLASFAIALPAVILFAALMLLPARILLDVSVDLAKPAFFVPTVYCAAVALLLYKTDK